MKISQRLAAAFDIIRGKAPRQTSNEFPYFYGFGMGNGRTGSGTPAIRNRVTSERLRRYSESPVVRRLINYLRSQVTRLDWQIDAKDGKKLTKAQLKQIEKIKTILRNPNPDDNFASWLGQMIEDMLVIGWGTSEIKRFRGGGDHEHLLYPVDASSVQVYVDWDGTPSKPRYAQVDMQGNEVPFKNSELMVLRHIPRTNTPFGLSPVEVAATEIEYLLSAMAFAGRTANNANPKKMLWLEGLTPEQIEQIRTWWRADVEGSGTIPILGGEAKANTLELGLVTDQNLFLKWQEFLVAIIADAFDVDVQKVNLIVGINRSTGDNLDDVTDESAIRPLASTIEQYINQYVLGLYGLSDDAEFKFRFTTSFTDRKKMSVVHQIYMQMDALTIDEVRAELGKPPLTHPTTGEAIGGFTLSAYRSMWNAQAAVDGPEKAVEIAMQQIEDQNNAGNGADADLDTAGGGNNGVYGTKTPRDKPLNRADEREDA